MAKKTISYNRWIPLHESSWAYRTFNQYDTELNRLVMSYTSASKYTFSHLKKDGAIWADKASKYLYTNNNNEITIKDWADTYNLFENWIRLNELLALSSYFETYLSCIIGLSFESDPGLLIGSIHSVDGIKLLKDGHTFKKEDFKQRIIDCTRGDWNSRISYMKSTFGSVPQSLIDGRSELDKMRILRNKVGHAFGRDIEKSRNYALTQIHNMETLKTKQFLKYQKMIKKIASDIDQQLMNNHIGNFQPLYHYHLLYPSAVRKLNDGERMMLLKKSIGGDIKETYSKDFCRWVVTYYDQL